MNRRSVVADALANAVERMDSVLNPWGFIFEFDAVCGSHSGPYASGQYVRGPTRIGLSCREKIDNVYYRHSFTTHNARSVEIETFTIGHDTLMRALGHSDDCWLIAKTDTPDAIDARHGGDRITALMHDWSKIAATALREPSDQFHAIVRRGSRGYSVR